MTARLSLEQITAWDLPAPEFIAMSTLPSLANAVSLVDALEAADVGIVVDALHWTRSGGTTEELAALDPANIGAIQLCDGPANMPQARQLFQEGFLQRRIPREGRFAFADFLGALPPDRLIGVEVQLKISPIAVSQSRSARGARLQAREH